MYKECQVILFAIKTYSQDCSGSPEILLNPSNDYVIRESDRCVYISESPREIKDIEFLVRIAVFSPGTGRSNNPI